MDPSGRQVVTSGILQYRCPQFFSICTSYLIRGTEYNTAKLADNTKLGGRECHGGEIRGLQTSGQNYG